MTAGHSCPRCGEPVSPQDRYCEHCGVRVADQPRDRVEVDVGIAAGVSDRGRRHHRNEDALELRDLGVSGRDGIVAIVCDGVSTAARPDEASETAAEVAVEALVAALRADEDPAAATLEAIHAAGKAVAELADGDGTDGSAPACTLVSAVVTGDAITVGWVGDSRAYWIPRIRTESERPSRLTEDDSWLAQVLAAGLLTPTQAAADRRAHAITAWLGKDATEMHPHVVRIEPKDQGVVVICTDGLWNYLDDVEELTAALPTNALEAPLDAARRLVEIALQAGGRDNITVAVLPFVARPIDTPPGGPVVTSSIKFHGAVHQNLYLAEGGREVHAVITVDAARDLAATANAPPPEAAEVIILDCSGSMGSPPEKIVKAKQAAGVAIDGLRDGVRFALIAGSFGARMLWPAQPELVRADPRTRSAAKEALSRLGADGGTTIGAWLRLAGQLLREHPGVIRHALLLTDGRNQHESPEELAAALQDCVELFTCDCRGVGTDWSVAELRTISSALHGTVELVVEPADLAEDFRTVINQSMGKAVAEIGLRLWTPEGATVKLVKQIAPTLVDLSTRRVDSGPLTGDYPTGSWGTESRDYHLCIELEPGGVGEEKLACRATFVHSDADGTQQPLSQTFSHAEPHGRTNDLAHARIRALWTDDLAETTVINDKVAVVTGRAELARAVQEGLAAHQRGESDLAVDHLDRARELAGQVGDTDLLTRLNQIYDQDSGTFRLTRMSAQDEMRLDIESTKTTLLGRG